MKQKQVDTGVCTLLFVEVPDGAFNVQYANIQGNSLVIFHNTVKNRGVFQFRKPTYDGNWQLLCKVSEVKEDIAQWIVKVEPDGFECWDYEKDFWGGFGFDPEESFHSLLRANGIDWDVSRTYIFKLIEQ